MLDALGRTAVRHVRRLDAIVVKLHARRVGDHRRAQAHGKAARHALRALRHARQDQRRLLGLDDLLERGNAVLVQRTLRNDADVHHARTPRRDALRVGLVAGPQRNRPPSQRPRPAAQLLVRFRRVGEHRNRLIAHGCLLTAARARVPRTLNRLVVIAFEDLARAIALLGRKRAHHVDGLVKAVEAHIFEGKNARGLLARARMSFIEGSARGCSCRRPPTARPEAARRGARPPRPPCARHARRRRRARWS